MVFNLFILSIVCLLSVFFLSQTEIYYNYCKIVIETGDYLVIKDVVKFE